MSEDNFNFEEDFEFEIDFDAIKDLKPVDEGSYYLSCASAKPGKSKKGNAKITLQWVIQDGEEEGRSIYDDLVWTEKSMFRIKQAMVAMEMQGGTVTPEEFVGQSVKAIVAIQPGNGNDPLTNEPYPARNRIRKYMRLTEEELELFA